MVTKVLKNNFDEISSGKTYGRQLPYSWLCKFRNFRTFIPQNTLGKSKQHYDLLNTKRLTMNQTVIRHYLIIVLLNICILSFAQPSEKKPDWILKWNPTSSIDIFSFPTVQFSMEKKITDYVSLIAEFGYQCYDFRQMDTTFLAPKGFKCNIEGRFYLSKISHSSLAGLMEGTYIGIQPFIRRNQYTTGISYLTDPDTIHYKSDDFGVKKFIYGINCIMGMQRTMSSRLIVDLYLGIGILNRLIKNGNRQYNVNLGEHIASRGPDFNPRILEKNLSEQSGFGVNLTFGLRLGIKL